MRVAITGASGFIGTPLVDALRTRGDEVLRIGRGGDADVQWDPVAGRLEPAALEGLDALVHLAAQSIGERRWTPEEKARIRDSRVRGTDLVARTLASLRSPPATLLSASAVGWYGDRGDERLTEHSAPPAEPDFLAEVARAWEDAAKPAEDVGIRTAHLRTGIVLSPAGGVLRRLLLPFKLGLGGRIASGRQYMSWITLADEVGAILHVLGTPSLTGPVNLTAPEPVTNAELTDALGSALRRPTILPTPLAPLRLRYGAELVQSLLVGGQRVLPAALEATGYEFRCAKLPAALATILA